MSTASRAQTAEGIVSGEIDIHSAGAKGNGTTVDGAAIEIALLKNPHGKFYFPRGIYLLDNSNRGGLSGRTFSGSLRFAPGAILKCTDVGPRSRDCVGFSRGSGLTIDGMEIDYAQPTPQPRNHAAGAALHTMFQTGMKVSNLRIDGSTSAGVYSEMDVDSEFSNISIKNTTADGFSVVNGKNTRLSNLTTDVTMDDGLSIINYASNPDNQGFVGTNIKVSRSAARGITVPGQSNVQVSNFSVSQTCAQGVLIFNDLSFKTRTPDNVKFSQGEISEVGAYTNERYPCKNQQTNGIGIHYIAAGSVSLDHIKITGSTAGALAGNTGPTSHATASASISDIDIAGPPLGTNGAKVGGVVIYKTGRLVMSKISLQNASGGFFISHNDDVEATDLSAKDVKGYLHRSFDFENNGKVQGNRLITTDDQDTPTGNEFVDFNNKEPASYRGVEAHIAKSSLKIEKGSNSTVERVTPQSAR
ncbi:MAG TPA: hypothetical protein VK604_12790 [Bryobacteraceae bacterium]|nr:hypothetical protein [Bryobacteraceae bacterium]HTF69053.1 hypothetical protein [Edaphobacter sp.]